MKNTVIINNIEYIINNIENIKEDKVKLNLIKLNAKSFDYPFYYLITKEEYKELIKWNLKKWLKTINLKHLKVLV